MSVEERARGSILWRMLAIAVAAAIPIALLVGFVDRVMADRLVDRALDSAALERGHLVNDTSRALLVGDPLEIGDLADASQVLDALVASFGADELTIVRADGTVLWASDPSAIGLTVQLSASGSAALAGDSTATELMDGRLRYLTPIYSSSGGASAMAELIGSDEAGIVAAATADGAALRGLTVRLGGIAWLLAVVLLGLVSGRHWRLAAHHRRLAMHDSLTGLANRSQFHDRLEEVMGGAARSKGRVGLVLLDLDGFKAINDTGGHAAGDRLLQRVAARLKSATRRNELPCRLGGDEFAIIIPSLEDRDQLVALADRLHAELELDVDFADGRSLRVSASLGLAVYPDDATSVDDLLSAADVGMYTVKASRKQQMRKHLATNKENQYVSQAWH